jgi:hypothetical protein
MQPSCILVGISNQPRHDLGIRAIKPFLNGFRRKLMKTKKEQKAKGQTKNGRKAIAAAPTVKSRKQDAEPKRTIKQVVIETLAAKSIATNGEMIAAVKSEFPKSAFKDSHAAWYRSQARKGLLTGTPIEIPAQRQPKSGN